MKDVVYLSEMDYISDNYTLKTKQNVYAARYNAEAGCFESVVNGTWSNGGTTVLGASTAEGVITFEKGLGMMAKGVGAEIAAYAMVDLADNNYGTMDDYLYISKHKDEWEADQQLIRHGETIVYVVNRDDPFCSEIG